MKTSTWTSLEENYFRELHVTRQNKSVPVHVMKVHDEVEVQLQSFLNLLLNGRGCLASRLDRFKP